jgi:hypothetical protein
MWKSVRFQQVFRLFGQNTRMWKKQKKGLPGGHNQVTIRVTSIPVLSQLEMKILEFVPFLREIARQKQARFFSPLLFL